MRTVNAYGRVPSRGANTYDALYSSALQDALSQFAPLASNLKSLRRGKRQQTPFGRLGSVMALIALLREEWEEFCWE